MSNSIAKPVKTKKVEIEVPELCPEKDATKIFQVGLGMMGHLQEGRPVMGFPMVKDGNLSINILPVLLLKPEDGQRILNLVQETNRVNEAILRSKGTPQELEVTVKGETAKKNIGKLAVDEVNGRPGLILTR